MDWDRARRRHRQPATPKVPEPRTPTFSTPNPRSRTSNTKPETPKSKLYTYPPGGSTPNLEHTLTPDYRGTSLIRPPPPGRTLQWPYAWGPMVILGGWVFLMSEVPL